MVTVLVSVGVPEIDPVEVLKAIPAGSVGVIAHEVAGEPALRGLIVASAMFLYPV